MHNELSITERYDPRYWQEGVAGNCNVVSFDGEDIRGVLWIADEDTRRRVIAAQNKCVRAILRSNA